MTESITVEWEGADEEDAIFTSKCGTFGLCEDAVFGTLSLRLREDGNFSLGEPCSINEATRMATDLLETWAADPAQDPHSEIRNAALVI